MRVHFVVRVILGLCFFNAVNYVNAQDGCITLRNDFNVFSHRDMFAKFAEVGGRVAVGGDADISFYDIGLERFRGRQEPCRDVPEDRLTERDFSLIVEKKLTLRDTHVFNGGIAYGDRNSIIDLESSTVPRGCPIVRKDVLDFNRLHRSLVDTSREISRIPRTSNFRREGRKLTLELNGAVPVEVFEIPAEELKRADFIVVRGRPRERAPIIINVSGRRVHIKCLFMEDLAPYQQRVLWNLFEATEASISGTGIRGSVLAPNARLANESGIIWGQVFVESWGSRTRAGTIAVKNVPFDARICPRPIRTTTTTRAPSPPPSAVPSAEPIAPPSPSIP